VVPPRVLAALALAALFPAGDARGQVLALPQHALFPAVCSQPRSPWPDDALYARKREAIGNTRWQGRRFASKRELWSAAMQDVRVKLAYFRELARLQEAEPHLGDIFRRMRSALLAQVDDASMRERLGGVTLVDPVAFLQRDVDTMSVFYFSWKSRGHHLEQACGSDGLLLSAFYYSPDNAVVVCPGTELRLARGEIPPQSLAFLLAHEIAHAIDVEPYPSHYGFLETDWGIEPRYHKESSADYWAAKTLLGASTDTLQTNLAYFCGLPEVTFGFARYPSGDNRVNVVLHQLTAAHETVADTRPGPAGRD
jgi:hypothetical protein